MSLLDLTSECGRSFSVVCHKQWMRKFCNIVKSDDVGGGVGGGVGEGGLPISSRARGGRV